MKRLNKLEKNLIDVTIYLKSIDYYIIQNFRDFGRIETMLGQIKTNIDD